MDRDKHIGVRHSFSIRKNKVFTIAGSGEFVRMAEPSEVLGLDTGQVDDYATVMKYARDYGLVHKEKDWYYFKRHFPTLQEIVDFWKSHPVEYMKAQYAIIMLAKKALTTCQKSNAITAEPSTS